MPSNHMYGSGVASLIGDTDIQLDGQSVQLPEDSGWDTQDDVSSINDASYLQGVGGGRGPSNIKIVGTAESMEEGTIEPLTPMSTFPSDNNNDNHNNNNSNSYGRDNRTGTSYQDRPESSSANKNNSLTDSFKKKPPNMRNTSKLGVGDRKKRGGNCCPTWVSAAPTWLKCVIIFSLALLLGAVVLVTVALTTALAASETTTTTSSTPATSTGMEGLSPVVPVVSQKPEEVGTNTNPSPAPTTLLPFFTYTPAADEDEAITSSPAETPTQSTTMEVPAESTPAPEPLATPLPTAGEETDNPTATVVAEEVQAATPTPTTTPEVQGGGNDKDTKEEPTQEESTESQYDSAVTTFFVTGGRFTNDGLTLVPEQLRSMPVRGGTSFMVHLGDWNSPYATRCDRQSYQDVNTLFSNSSIPVYFVPGDNDFNDCPNPNQAMGLWHEYLLDYETQHWEAPTQWTVERAAQGNFEENFAFVYNEILFVGINLVGGVVHDANEWSTRQAANLQWIDDNFQRQRNFVKGVVLFAHADPDVPSNSAFYGPFKNRVKNDYSDVPFVLIHRNLGVEPWSWETEFENISNLSVVVVAGSIWPPLMGAVDFRQPNPFIFDQSSWYEEYVEHEAAQAQATTQTQKNEKDNQKDKNGGGKS